MKSARVPTSETAALFFLSAAVFALQVLLSPVLTTILAGLNIQLVMSAPVLAFALASLTLTFVLHRRKQTGTLFTQVALGATALGIPACLFLLTVIQTRIDHQILQQLTLTSGRFVGEVQGPLAQAYFLPLIAVLALPYFAYGLFVSSLLVRTESKRRARRIGAELAGALLGWVGGIGALESGSFGRTLLLAQIFAVIAWLTFPHVRRRWASVLICGMLVGLVSWAPAWFEPHRDPHFAAFDLGFEKNVRELAQTWTTYAKVQKLEVADDGQPYRLLAVGEGQGMAGLFPFSATGPGPRVATTDLAQIFGPQKVLVIFAGAGREVMALHAQGVPDVTGIELNPGLLRLAREDEGTHLDEFLAQPGVRLLRADARVFLETTPESYDFILYSWSGATVGHYSGAILRTTQYAFTTEALAAAWRHLRPDGTMLVMGGPNKINLLASLRELEPQTDWRRRTVLVAPPNQHGWRSGWDDYALLIEKGPITGEEIARLHGLAFGNPTRAMMPGWPISRYRVVLAPGQDPAPEHLAVAKYLEAKDPATALTELNRALGSLFAAHGDDHPYVYNIWPGAHVFTVWFWRQHLASLATGHLGDPMNAAGVLAVLALLTAMVLNRRQIPQVMFFTSIGFFALAIQILGIYKLLLYASDPTLAVVLGLGGLMGASALGSLSQAYFRNGAWTERAAAILLLIDATLWGLSWRNEDVAAGFFNWTQSVRVLMLLIPLMILAFLASRLYVGRLQAARGFDAARAIAFDAWGAVLAVLWIPLLIEYDGFNATVSVLLVSLGLSLISLVWA